MKCEELEKKKEEKGRKNFVKRRKHFSCSFTMRMKENGGKIFFQTLALRYTRKTHSHGYDSGHMGAMIII